MKRIVFSMGSVIVCSFLCLALYGCLSRDEGNVDRAVVRGDDISVSGGSDEGGVRYYTFTANRPYRIEFRIDKSDVDAAEKILKEIDVEANTGSPGGMFGLSRGDPNFNLLYWRDIYNSVYNRSRNTVARLAAVFRRIKADENLNDAQTVYVIMRFVQFMKYDLPPGVGIYSPSRVLYEPGKGSVEQPPDSSNTGWNGAGDCDTKSLLLVMLLQACGYRAVVFDSYRYHHAMAGVNLPSADGVFMEFRGVRYYFIETTYPNWNIGQMPPQYGDLSYFYPIDPREDHRLTLHVVDQPAGGSGSPVTGQGPSEREGNNDMGTADLVSSLVIGGALDVSDGADWFRLGGQEGTYAAFTLINDDNGEFDAEVYNEGMMVGSTAGNDSKTVTCQIPGLCHVKVYRVKGEGKYTLHVSPGGVNDQEPNNSIETASTAAGSSILGTIDRPGDVDWFSLNGQEGYNATYTMFSKKGGNFRFEVYNDGSSVGLSGGEPVTAEHPGRVTVKVWSQGGQGWYMLNLERNR